ncbi:MAG: hypothetical protein M1835_004880 [Candelina submexicana]|nr:MAG: hypothetical protein M1835_004880 [Candelina submexicana]
MFDLEKLEEIEMLEEEFHGRNGRKPDRREKQISYSQQLSPKPDGPSIPKRYGSASARKNPKTGAKDNHDEHNASAPPSNSTTGWSSKQPRRTSSSRSRRKVNCQTSVRQASPRGSKGEQRKGYSQSKTPSTSDQLPGQHLDTPNERLGAELHERLLPECMKQVSLEEFAEKDVEGDRDDGPFSSISVEI